MEDKHFQLLFTRLQEISTQAIKDVSTMDADDLVVFVDQRADLVRELEPYLSLATPRDKQLINRMLEDEQVLVARMYELKNEASDWLQNRNTVRVQQSAYQQSYSIDSLFIDYRK